MAAAGPWVGSAPRRSPRSRQTRRWRALFAARHTEVRQRACPRCRASESVVPVVYGFPSSSLMAAVSSRQVRMGWDYKNERDHSWECLACSGRWPAFPFGAPTRADAEWHRQQRKAAHAPARGSDGPVPGESPDDGVALFVLRLEGREVGDHADQLTD